MDLAQLAGDTASLTVPYSGQEVKLKYRPSVATPARLKALTADTVDGDDEIDVFLQFVVDIVSSWDIKSGTKKIPVSIDGCAQVPMAILQVLVAAVVGDSQGGDSGEHRSSSAAG